MVSYFWLRLGFPGYSPTRYSSTGERILWSVYGWALGLLVYCSSKILITSAWTQPRRVEPLRVWFGGVGDHALLAVLPFS